MMVQQKRCRLGCLSLLFLSSGISPVHAFPVVQPISGGCSSQRILLFSSDDNQSQEGGSLSSISRRSVFESVAASGFGIAVANLPSIAGAKDLAPPSASVCDPLVSVWNRQGRILYLLGTAHVSQSSADLAGNLVREIHPDAVFVELDLKRVGGPGLVAKKIKEQGGRGQLVDDNGQPTSEIIIPQITNVRASRPLPPSSDSVAAGTDAPGLPSTNPEIVTEPKEKKPNLIMRAATAAVGNGLRGMYKKLDSAGFSAGEEFVVAIKEAKKQGAAIVLGDRDVEVTLRRVTEALAESDLEVLLNPSSEMEKSMAELIPSSGTNPTGDLNDPQFRSEFSSLVETIKAKENVKKLMSILQQSAPALYEALVSERDAYMAAGLNGLNEFGDIVAVMGVAHVEGVEANLRANGWTPAPVKCPKIAATVP